MQSREWPYIVFPDSPRIAIHKLPVRLTPHDPHPSFHRTRSPLLRRPIMKSKFPLPHKCIAALLLTFFLFTTSALAGPPLICHSFDIGNAKSLPWISRDWNLSGRESYDTKNLPADTITILDNDSTVLVHMETL